MGHSEDDAVYKITHKMKTNWQNRLKISALVWFKILYRIRYEKIVVILVQCPFNIIIIIIIIVIIIIILKFIIFDFKLMHLDMVQWALVWHTDVSVYLSLDLCISLCIYHK